MFRNTSTSSQMLLLNSWSARSAYAMFAVFFLKSFHGVKKNSPLTQKVFWHICNYLMCAVVFIQAYGWNYFNPSASVKALSSLFTSGACCVYCMWIYTDSRLIQKMFKNMWNCSFEVYMLHGSGINNMQTKTPNSL